jgi:hypothetical protein
MKESYGEGLASHTGPESCAGRRKAAGEALTGVHASQVLSPENGSYSRVPTQSPNAEATPPALLSRDAAGPGGVLDPERAWKHPTWELGDPTSVCESAPADRIEKSKDVRQ